MKAQHTPGPWRIEPVVANGDTKNTHMVCGGRGNTPYEQAYVADCRVSSYYRTKEETDANAALIAAAPDLLAACKAALPHIELQTGGLERDPEGDHLFDTLDWLRAAIAKAAG